jgi:cytidylate kinase
MIITIDGPAGTGKSTIARKVAEKLGFLYCDTGAIYRGLTYAILKERISIQDEEHLLEFLKKFRFQVISIGLEKRYFVNGEDVTDEIRTIEVTRRVSEISALEVVRKALLDVQRGFAKKENCVFEGRDMGTVVFPEAEVKIFLTASPHVRAKRRHLELKQKLIHVSEEEVLSELLQRDEFDSTRVLAPLKQASDAHLVDTSMLTIDGVVDAVLKIVGSH